VVKHHSPFIDRLNNVDDKLAEQAISEVYYPEIQQLAKDTLGARRVIIVLVSSDKESVLQRNSNFRED
jgi:hypothetical protein